MNDKAAAAHCATLVRERDRPRFVASLFAPADVRRRLFALYAFDSELRHIPEAATEPMIQAMRFQWWRDAVALLPGATRGHPVLEELAPVGETTALLSLVDARENSDQPATAEALVIAIAARLCGATPGENPIADFLGAALATRASASLAEGRRLWRRESRNHRGELPAYLPTTVIDMRHPVTEVKLYWRMLVMGLRNRF